jgi:cytidylate kinase
MMREVSLTEEDAKQQVLLKEAERKNSVKENFKVNIEDPANYDLIINTEFMGTENIVGIIKSALKFKNIPSGRKGDLK